MTLNLTFLQGMLSGIFASARQRRSAREAPAAAPLAELSQACEALMQPGGEASEIRIAHQALAAYARLGDSERLSFFTLLTERYGPCFSAVHRAYERFRAQEDQLTAVTLFEACEPRRQELLRRMNRYPGGTYELVKMRADLLPLLDRHPSLRALDADFAHLFNSWFNRGFLVLERIDWNTPAAILEKVIRYEAVHEIRDWNDLRRRLDPDNRRCYAFFHPATGDEPLIFVEVALCQGTPHNIRDILAGDEITDIDADTAVFYSISNCQDGLKGISFGNFLIKQVAQELGQELPGLERFVTLSPLPGFARWLREEQASGRVLLPESQLALLDDPAASRVLDDRLVELAAHYLLEVRDSSGRPLDPVARFHMGNGASLASINPRADLSPRGLSQSHGVMVNYLYELDAIERNHEAYSRSGTVVTTPDIERAARRVAAAG